jgi:hypothetical protein
MRHSSSCLLLSLLTLQACATRKEIVDFKKDTLFLRAQLDSLQNGQQSIHLMLNKLQAATAQYADSSTQWRGSLYAKLEQIAEQSRFLGNRLEETNQHLLNLPAQLRLTSAMAVISPPAMTKVNQVDTMTADQRP